MDMSTHNDNLSGGTGRQPSGRPWIFALPERDPWSVASVRLPPMPDSIRGPAQLRSTHDTSTGESARAQRGGIGAERLA